MCGDDIAAGDVLVKIFSREQDRTGFVPCCASCAPPGIDYVEPAPCDGCGREVMYEWTEHRRRYATCSEACRRAGYAKRRAAAREAARQKQCSLCKAAFAATRRDAIFCSPACRKDAFRERKARQLAGNGVSGQLADVKPRGDGSLYGPARAGL